MDRFLFLAGATAIGVGVLWRPFRRERADSPAERPPDVTRLVGIRITAAR
ncbi:MAG: hypothetical protein AB7I25_11415 [Vicinamibacterales bacterium]